MSPVHAVRHHFHFSQVTASKSKSKPSYPLPSTHRRFWRTRQFSLRASILAKWENFCQHQTCRRPEMSRNADGVGQMVEQPLPPSSLLFGAPRHQQLPKVNLFRVAAIPVDVVGVVWRPRTFCPSPLFAQQLQRVRNLDKDARPRTRTLNPESSIQSPEEYTPPRQNYPNRDRIGTYSVPWLFPYLCTRQRFGRMASFPFRTVFLNLLGAARKSLQSAGWLFLMTVVAFGASDVPRMCTNRNKVALYSQKVRSSNFHFDYF